MAHALDRSPLHQGPGPGDSGRGSRILGWARVGPFLLAHKAYDSTFSQTLHSHPIASFDFNVRGGGEGVVGRQHRASVGGEVEYFPHEVPHSFRSGARGIRVLHLSFRPDQCAGMGLTLPDNLRIDQAVAVGAAARVLNELHDCRASDPLLVEELALTMLGAATPAHRPREREPHWMPRVLERLHTDLAAELTLSQLARDVGVDRAHLARTFMATTGQTCGDYRRRLRVAAAQRMLAERNMPVSRVAFATGFADQAHLTRWFTRLAGITPARFCRAVCMPPRGRLDARPDDAPGPDAD